MRDCDYWKPITNGGIALPCSCGDDCEGTEIERDLARLEVMAEFPHRDPAKHGLRIHRLIDEIIRLRAKLTAANARAETAERERDAHERELHDECVMLHTALLGRKCAEPGATSACHPMVCDCGTPYPDYTFRDLCEAVTHLRTRAERMAKDSERLDWLDTWLNKRAGFDEDSRIEITHHKVGPGKQLGNFASIGRLVDIDARESDGIHGFGEGIRAAIDAARTTTPEAPDA